MTFFFFFSLLLLHHHAYRLILSQFVLQSLKVSLYSLPVSRTILTAVSQRETERQEKRKERERDGHSFFFLVDSMRVRVTIAAALYMLLFQLNSSGYVTCMLSVCKQQCSIVMLHAAHTARVKESLFFFIQTSTL